MHCCILATLCFATTHLLHGIRNLPQSLPSTPCRSSAASSYSGSRSTLTLLKLPVATGQSSSSASAATGFFLCPPATAEECLHKNDVVLRIVLNTFPVSILAMISRHLIGRPTVITAGTSVGSRILRSCLLTAPICSLDSVLRRFDRCSDGSIDSRLWKREDGEESVEGTRFTALISEISALGGLMTVGDFIPLMREISALGGLLTVGDFIPLLRWFRARGAEKRFKAVFEKTDAFMQDLVDDYKRRSVEIEESTDLSTKSAAKASV